MTIPELSRPVDLSEHGPISKGGRRELYEIESCPGILFKVPRKRSTPPSNSPAKRILRWFLPRSIDRAVFVEIDSYMHIVPYKPDVADAILPRFYGAVTSTRGPATLHEKVCDAEGGLAPTLADILSSGKLSPDHIGPLNHFMDTIRTRHIVVNDLRAANLVFSGGRFYLIDGLGDRNVIKLRTYSSQMNTRSLSRKARAIAERSPHLTWDHSAFRFQLVQEES